MRREKLSRRMSINALIVRSVAHPHYVHRSDGRLERRKAKATQLSRRFLQVRQSIDQACVAGRRVERSGPSPARACERDQRPWVCEATAEDRLRAGPKTAMLSMAQRERRIGGGMCWHAWHMKEPGQLWKRCLLGAALSSQLLAACNIEQASDHCGNPTRRLLHARSLSASSSGQWQTRNCR